MPGSVAPDDRDPLEAHPAALAPYHDQPRWVAWRNEKRGDDITKVPYNPVTHRPAKADDPTTWGTRPQAQAAARHLVNGLGGGVGLELGDLGDGYSLGGIDLDTCRSDDGAFAPWAVEVMGLLQSYTETSPSGSGAKIFFRYQTTDLSRLDLGDAKFGRAFKRNTGRHPPAIELYLSHRYFAVTDAHLPDAPDEIALVPLDTLKHLVDEVGPAFARPAGRKAPSSSGTRDASRSATAFRKGAALRRSGATYEAMVEALRADPETADWAHEKGDPQGGREFKRIWEKAEVDEINADALKAVAELNRRYMLVNEAGKAVIYQPGDDPILKRRYFARLTTRDLQTFYLNQRIQAGLDAEGKPVFKTKANVWLSHPDRHQYIHGVVFDPSGAEPKDGVLNLWAGFAITPAPGDWSILRDHIRTNICGGREEHFDYLIRWMARMVQRPAEQGEVAVVLKGGEGTGKGTLAKALLRILGQHGLAISNPKHLTGNFNGHLRDCIFLFADEAFYAGDKQHVGVLKSLITEPTLTVEAKFQNAIETPNMLHLLMASNEEWVVPASLDARRFFVLLVSDLVKNDHAYFAELWAQMEAGGYAAMLHNLLALDISDFNVRAVPTTGAL